jgi:SAM-dependent MidA family methyltransferase
MADNHHQMPSAAILANPLQSQISEAIALAGGWTGFDDFMALALYAPGLGYYASPSAKFGTMPRGVGGAGSDFVTAPEMTPLFAQTLAAQVAQALATTQTSNIWEFGAGTGALALHVLGELDRLGVAWQTYTIIDLSGSLRVRQQEKLSAFGEKIRWVDQLPAKMRGVVVGNEVLDAMPVKLLVRKAGEWFERGVGLAGAPVIGMESPFIWRDRPTDLRPPREIEGPHDYLCEIHAQAEAFVRTLADRLDHGMAFFIDYGFPEHEYYHPQRHMGTLMCHQAHLADSNPLANVGLKDITAHVNFTGIALAAQEAGFDVLGYCSQARFLMNCGMLALLENASFADKAMAQKLLSEHEMGELFKVMCLAKSGQPGGPATDWPVLGFAAGDRTHRL